MDIDIQVILQIGYCLRSLINKSLKCSSSNSINNFLTLSSILLITTIVKNIILLIKLFYETYLRFH